LSLLMTDQFVAAPWTSFREGVQSRICIQERNGCGCSFMQRDKDGENCIRIIILRDEACRTIQDKNVISRREERSSKNWKERIVGKKK
jgi:hypothetical protein